jgi:hypothetical protein
VCKQFFSSTINVIGSDEAALVRAGRTVTCITQHMQKLCYSTCDADRDSLALGCQIIHFPHVWNGAYSLAHAIPLPDCQQVPCKGRDGCIFTIAHSLCLLCQLHQIFLEQAGSWIVPDHKGTVSDCSKDIYVGVPCI